MEGASKVVLLIFDRNSKHGFRCCRIDLPCCLVRLKARSKEPMPPMRRTWSSFSGKVHRCECAERYQSPTHPWTPHGQTALCRRRNAHRSSPARCLLHRQPNSKNKTVTSTTHAHSFLSFLLSACLCECLCGRSRNPLTPLHSFDVSASVVSSPRSGFIFLFFDSVYHLVFFRFATL